MSSKRENTIGVIYLSLTAVCWGFVPTTVKLLTATVDPYTISFARVFMASLVFGLMFARQGGDWKRLRWFLPWILLGALGRAGNYLLFNSGLVFAPSNAATILAPVQTIGIIFLARLAIGEGLQDKWSGLILSLAGLGLIWWNGRGWTALLDPQYFWGNLLLIGAGFASSVQFASQRALSFGRSSLEILLPVFVLSTVITTPFALSVGDFGWIGSPTTWSLLLTLGFVLTGGSFFFLGEGYKRCDATTGVVITNTGIFLTLVLSRFLLNEAVDGMMVLGAVLAVVGAVAIVRSDRRKIARQPERLTGSADRVG